MHYHPLSVLCALAAVLLGGLATPLTPRWNEMRVKHAWNTVPENWERLGHSPAGATIDLHLALKSHHENALIETLYEVSNPGHPKYGAHLSREQVAELVTPHPATLQLVSSWLEQYGITSSSISTTLGGNWLTVIGVSVSQANVILDASYHLYQHVETNDTVLRTISYSLPDALHGHVQSVVPTTYFGFPLTEGTKSRMRPSLSAAVEAREEAARGSGSSRKKYVTPPYLRWLYKTASYVPAAADRNVVGIAGYAMQYPSPQDLNAFMKKYRADGADATFTVVQINGGGYDPSNPSAEANLDIQYSEAMAYPTPHIYYSTGGLPLVDDPYIHWLNYVLGQASIPQTISTSYGGNELNVPPDYAMSVCNLFAQLGARGVSILFASGDQGVGEGKCIVKDSSGNPRVRFLPLFPATCPYVTSVGGTTRDTPEVAASISGGGFSNYFTRPSYQVNAVPTFFEKFGDKHRGLYNPNGRGHPDIAAQALRLDLVLGGRDAYTSGTSGSTPTVAAIISLLNDYRISIGNHPLGFLNPWLYGSGRAGLNDIVSGSNPGCGTTGFPAVVGWDPVTGLGTPDFDKMIRIINDRLRNLGASSSNTTN